MDKSNTEAVEALAKLLRDEKWRIEQGYYRSAAMSILTSLSPTAKTEPSAEGELPCQECGGPNPAWFADNALWNLVMGGQDAKDDPGGILCPTCFIAKAGETLRVTNPEPSAEGLDNRWIGYLARDVAEFLEPDQLTKPESSIRIAGHVSRKWRTILAALLSRKPSAPADTRAVFQQAMVDVARKHGGAGALFIARGNTNLWIDIAYEAYQNIAHAERERCAKLCDDFAAEKNEDGVLMWKPDCITAAEQLAALIRGEGGTDGDD